PIVCEECATCEDTVTGVYGGGSGGTTSGGGSEPVYFWGNPDPNDDNDEAEEEIVEEELFCPEPEEVIRYITVTPDEIPETTTEEAKEEATPISTNENAIVLFDYPTQEEQTLLEPIIIVLGDKEGIVESTISLNINGYPSKFKLNHEQSTDYQIYSLIYTPTEAYPINSTVLVQIGFIEKDKTASSSESFTFQTGDNYPVFFYGEKTIEEVPTDMEILNLFLEQNKYEQMELAGETKNTTEVEVTWYGKDDTVQVIKKTKGNIFNVRSPIDFEPGTYQVEITAKNDDGLETLPINIQFTVNGEQLFVHNVDNPLYGSAEPEPVEFFWRWVLAIVNTLFGMHLVGDTFPQGL
ncbi:Ig-like domain-containing protein, partial [Candidatus Peregrinibacteria bacterium]|nr:Ig-like domain-containing protein [Candidatus Peregrinibacteria bacterium]